MSVVDREKGHGPGDTEEEPQGDKEQTVLVWRMLINVIDLFYKISSRVFRTQNTIFQKGSPRKSQTGVTHIQTFFSP